MKEFSKMHFSTPSSERFFRSNWASNPVGSNKTAQAIAENIHCTLKPVRRQGWRQATGGRAILDPTGLLYRIQLGCFVYRNWAYTSQILKILSPQESPVSQLSNGEKKIKIRAFYAQL